MTSMLRRPVRPLVAIALLAAGALLAVGFSAARGLNAGASGQDVAHFNLPPTNTFELGFWFNDPADAQACGFDPSRPTPFNGEHHAGPLAMISLPDAGTGLGPLCLKPDTSVTPARCNP